MSEDSNTEAKIEEAARALFMQKGYDGTKTRDIAEKAGINLALLNYYYRSKEKLFNKIMMEALTLFMNTIFKIFQDEKTTLEQKFELISAKYIDRIKRNPDIPYFVLNELRTRPESFLQKVSKGRRVEEFVIFKQLVERMGPEKVKQINPYHIMTNLMSLTLFPFLSKPMMKMMTGIENAEFNRMMEERKKLIPKWVMAMLE